MVCEERDVRGGEIRGTSYGPLLRTPSPTTRRGLPPRGSCAVSPPTPPPPWPDVTEALPPPIAHTLPPWLGLCSPGFPDLGMPCSSHGFLWASVFPPDLDRAGSGIFWGPFQCDRPWQKGTLCCRDGTCLPGLRETLDLILTLPGS